jgi:hypothetical protein
MADNLVGDQRAIDLVMGHKRGDISEVYTHRVDDQRLERIATAVHDWLFPPKTQNREATNEQVHGYHSQGVAAGPAETVGPSNRG